MAPVKKPGGAELRWLRLQRCQAASATCSVAPADASSLPTAQLHSPKACAFSCPFPATKLWQPCNLGLACKLASLTDLHAAVARALFKPGEDAATSPSSRNSIPLTDIGPRRCVISCAFGIQVSDPAATACCDGPWPPSLAVRLPCVTRDYSMATPTTAPPRPLPSKGSKG